MSDSPTARDAPLPTFAQPRVYAWVLGITLLFRLVLAARFPLLSDEAYFLNWGRAPELGYYDHPPMVGWIAWMMLQLSDAPLMVRLPAVLAPLLASAVVIATLRALGSPWAWLAGTLILLAPVNVINVFYTTDTPLMVFMTLSGASYVLAVQRNDLRAFALAGALLGLAFLSKYLAVLLGVAFLAHGLLSPALPRRGKALSILLACALPFGLLHAWWNYHHCWSTLLFNAFNRTGDAQVTSANMLLYIGTVLYVLCPVALYRSLRGTPRATTRESLREAWARPATRAWLLLWTVPLGVLLAVALGKTVGLHWLIGFSPFFFATMVLWLPPAALRASMIYLATLSALHVLLMFGVLYSPLDLWRSSRLFQGVVYHLRMPQLLAQVDALRGGAILISERYSQAALASYHGRRYVPVWVGEPSYHGRQDDILTDFRPYAGARLAVLHKGVPKAGMYEPYFSSVRLLPIHQDGARFTLVMGEAFRFDVYRDRLLKQVREDYYRIPAWLPVAACYFCDRYFPAEPYLRR